MASGPVAATSIPEQTRAAGRPSLSRDRTELRVAVQDAVYQFTELKRQALWEEVTKKHPEYTQQQVELMVDVQQPRYQEYDPVVALAVMAVDHSLPPELRLRGHAETAQYLRPKLKSVELVVNPDDPETREQKKELLGRLASLLDAGAAAKRATIDVTPNGEKDPER